MMNDTVASRFQFKFDHINVFKHMGNYLYNVRSHDDINPVRLFLHPSGLCNDNCKYCKTNMKAPIETDLFRDRGHLDKLARDIKELGIIDIHMLGGGEPFFYKDNMFYFLEKLINEDAFIRIITNGNNLNDADIRAIVKDGLVSQLNITLSTDSEEMAGRLYQRGERHSRTIALLESIQKYKDLYNTQAPNIDIMFVLSNLNFDKIDRIVASLKKFGINYFFMQPLRINCDDYRELELSDRQRKEFLGKIPEIEEQLNKANIRSNINDFRISDEFIANSRDYKSVISDTVMDGRYAKIGCYFPLSTIAIHHDGVIPKCYFANPAFDKNYFSISSLKEEVMNGQYKEYARDFIGATCHANCDTCRICVLYEIEEIKKIFSAFRNERQ